MNYYIQDGRYGMRDRMGEGVAPSVLIKDRSVVGCADRGLNCNNRMPGVEVVETGKPSTASLRKYRTSSPPLRASRVVAKN